MRDTFSTATTAHGIGHGARGLAAAAAAALATALATPASAVAPAPPPLPDYFPTLQSGDALWRNCGGSLDVRAPDRCWAYVAGVSDAARVAGLARTGACLPADVRADELADVVRRFLAGHPESRRYPAAQVVGAALMRAYPCADSQAR